MRIGISTYYLRVVQVLKATCTASRKKKKEKRYVDVRQYNAVKSRVNLDNPPIAQD